MKNLLFIPCAILLLICNSTKATPTNSVLDSGDWYKLSTSETGIHFISYGDLVALGINVSVIDPRNIAMYGNGPGALPESNSAPRPGDLTEIAIKVQGESDGTFDTGDTIFFYSHSQITWQYDSSEQMCMVSRNPYTDSVSFFLTIGATPGKRIADRTSLGTFTDSTSTFTDFTLHELDSTNFLHSGRDWYGEEFNLIDAQSRTFPIPMNQLVNTEPVYIHSSFAGRSISPSTNSLDYLSNGTLESRTFPYTGNSVQDNFASLQTANFEIAPPISNGDIQISLNTTDPNALAWLDFIQMNFTRNLVADQSQLCFRDSRKFGPGKIVKYSLTGAANGIQVWDVSNFSNVENQLYSGVSPAIYFSADNTTLHEFIAFDGTSYYHPVFQGLISNQNLQAINQANMIIVSGSDFMTEANTLAQHHISHDQLNTIAVDVNQIYNEFSGGQQDPVAIRDLIRRIYFSSGALNDSLKYVLLFGNASYDYKNHLGYSNSIIPIYESPNSLNRTQSYCSDDFLALLDSTEGNFYTNESCDIAIGRIPVQNSSQASVINKIINYQTNSDWNSWRAELTWVGDDEDGNVHVRQIDTLAETVDALDCRFSGNKIYLDAYVQQTTGSQQSYPDVEVAIKEALRKGTSYIHYTGQSGHDMWASEHVLDAAYLDTLHNASVLPAFFVFGQSYNLIDDPTITSGGRMLVMNPNGGGISCISPARLAFSSSNNNFSQAYIRKLFTDINGTFPTPGEAFLASKKHGYTDPYIRSINFLGDPAVKIVFPENNIAITNLSSDTLIEGQTVQIDAEVRGVSGNLLSSFNGNVDVTLYNPKTQHITLANDGNTNPFPFQAWDDTLFHGSVTASGGVFSISFVVPAGIDSVIGNGKLSFYAQDGITTAAGCNSQVVLNGLIAGVDELNNISLQISPNPATNMLNCSIDLKNQSGWSYSLIGIDGRILTEQMITSSQFSIERKSLATGLYFLQIRNAKNQQVKMAKVMFD